MAKSAASFLREIFKKLLITTHLFFVTLRTYFLFLVPYLDVLRPHVCIQSFYLSERKSDSSDFGFFLDLSILILLVLPGNVQTSGMSV